MPNAAVAQFSILSTTSHIQSQNKIWKRLESLSQHHVMYAHVECVHIPVTPGQLQMLLDRSCTPVQHVAHDVSSPSTLRVAHEHSEYATGTDGRTQHKVGAPCKVSTL